MQSGAPGPATLSTTVRSNAILSPVPNLEPCSAARTFDVRAPCRPGAATGTAPGATATATVTATAGASAALSSFGFCHLHPGATFDHFSQQQRGFHLTICRCFQLPFGLLLLLPAPRSPPVPCFAFTLTLWILGTPWSRFRSLSQRFGSC